MRRVLRERSVRGRVSGRLLYRGFKRGAGKAAVPRPGKATVPGAGGDRQDGAGGVSLRVGSPDQDFPGESDIPYEIAEATMGAPMPADISRTCAAMLALASPLLGAMSNSAKRKLERMAGNRRVFSSEVATGLNVVLNFALYPCLAVVGSGQSLFSSGVNSPIALAALLASIETVFRLRDGFKALPVTEMRFGSALYGAPLTWLFMLLLLRRREFVAPSRLLASFEGYYGGCFDTKVERLRRYGRIWELDERKGAYYLRLELPRLLPESAAKQAFGFGDEMPEYALELNIRGAAVTIEGHVVDERVRRLCSLSPAFPSDFRSSFELGAEPGGFRHRYQGKVLEILFFKKGANTAR